MFCFYIFTETSPISVQDHNELCIQLKEVQTILLLTVQIRAFLL